MSKKRDAMNREVAQLVRGFRRAPFRIRKRTMHRISLVWFVAMIAIVNTITLLQSLGWLR